MILVLCQGPQCQSVAPPPAVFQNPNSAWVVRSDVGGNGDPTHFCTPECEIHYVQELINKRQAALTSRTETE